MRWSFWAFQFFVNPLHQTSASIYNKYRWRIYVNYSEKPCCYDSILKIKSIKKWLQSERSLQRENFHRGKVSHGEMSEISGCRSLSLLLILATISLQFIPGFSDDDSSSSKNSTKAASHATSNSSNGSTLAIIFLGLVVVGLLSLFLFKLWQKKKREEQYARLLKLFEEDDELELELGLRD